MADTAQNNFVESVPNDMPVSLVFASQWRNDFSDAHERVEKGTLSPWAKPLINPAVERSDIERPSQTDTDTQPFALRANWHRLVVSDLSGGLFTRIERIAAKSDGWKGAGSLALKASSLRDFLTFWRLVSDNSVEPFVTLAQNGNLFAEWHVSWRKHLDLEFPGNGEVFVGLFHNREIIEAKQSIGNFVHMATNRRRNPLEWE